MIAFILAACGLVFLIALHLTAGQKEIVRPLMRTDALPADVINTLFICWHTVTLVMVLALLAYVTTAILPEKAAFALAATITMALMSLWCLAVVLLRRLRHRDMPQWIAFGIVAILGAWGQWSL